MGTTVNGLKPTHPVGEEFRRNVWGWTPLFNYIVEKHTKYEKNFLEQALTKLQASKLADLLFEDIASGIAEQYADKFTKKLETLKKLKCEICDGTGIRTDAVGVEQGMDTRKLVPLLAEQVGRDSGWCNGCGGYGEKKSLEAEYYLEVEDIQEFAEFLKNSGGANW